MVSSSGSAAQKSDDESALIRAEYDRVVSNRDAVERWIKRALPFEQIEQRAIAVSMNDVARHADSARECADKNDSGKAREHLEQADEKMYKALDDAVASIKEDMQGYEKKPGYASLSKHFGHYQELSGVLTRIGRRIDNSREDREQRNELYRDIAEGSDFKDLLRYFDELRGSIIAIRSIDKWYHALVPAVLPIVTLLSGLAGALISELVRAALRVA